MSIGVGILLFVIGAILAFAVEVDLQFIDGQQLGYILMLAGLLVGVLSFAAAKRTSRHVAVTRDSAGRETVTERRAEHNAGPADPVV